MSDYEFECPKCGGNNDASELLDARVEVAYDHGIGHAADPWCEETLVECGHCGVQVRVDLEFTISAHIEGVELEEDE